MTYAQRTDLVIVLGIIMVTLVILAAALPAPRPSTQPSIPVLVIPAAIGTASRETVSVGTASGKAVASRTTVPSSTARPSAAPLRTVQARPAGVVRTLAGHSLTGTSSWYKWRVGQAAAGPRLRAAIGPRWRGRLVTVRVAGRCIPTPQRPCWAVVRLTDWCRCSYSRVIDLDSRSFARLARLSVGIATVTVRW